MGGGDLNLKKSWHPSTMKNMEKVWKAEQQNDQEKRKIAELKKEMEMEKDREDITRYAMEQGVIEKKGEKKLDWMYKGPNQMVNREDYLLGRPVDKAFEQMAQVEKEADLNRVPKNHVEYECIPPSLRFFSGNEQVDLARKMQEDPLYAIKKKEIETRNQLLKNPVKLKQLRELLEQQSCKSKNEKKRKKLKQKHSSDDDDDEAKLDMLLLAKYKELKDNIKEKNLLKSMRKVKHKRKKKSKKHHNSKNKSDSSDGDICIKEKRRKRKRKKSASNSDSSTDSSSESDVEQEKGGNKEESDGYCRERKSSKDRNSVYERDKRYKKEYNRDSKRLRYGETRQKDNSERDRHNDERKRYDMTSNSGKTFGTSSNTAYKRFNEDKKGEEKWRSRPKHKLTEEEKEQRRQEMMANAMWRDKEREQNVKLYREQEKREMQNNKSYSKDFIRKQLVVATEVGTVASRIKANINNIQRSGRAMDTNFAKR